MGRTKPTTTATAEQINHKEILDAYLPNTYVQDVIELLKETHGSCNYSENHIIAVKRFYRKNIIILEALLTVAEKEKKRRESLKKRLEKLSQ